MNIAHHKFIDGMSDEVRVRNQTVDEWIQEYTTGEKVIPKNWSHNTVDNTIILEYVTHRTTALGSLVLEFRDPITRSLYSAFFNVDLTVQRGKDKGKRHKVGAKGMFYPPERGKLREWWINIVGKEPKRWASLNKELKPRLSKLNLTGDFDISYTKANKPFNRVKNLKLIEQ